METVKQTSKAWVAKGKKEFFFQDDEFFNGKQGFRDEFDELSFRLCPNIKDEKSALFDSVLN